MTDEERQVAEQLVRQLGGKWPDWSAQLQEQERRLSTHEAIELSIPVPGRHDHALRFAIRGPREVEVHYDDSEEPRPAEKLFVWGSHESAADGVAAVVQFTQQLVRGEFVVVREPSPWWVRLLKGGEADSVLRIVDKATAARQASHWRRVYSWPGASS